MPKQPVYQCPDGASALDLVRRLRAMGFYWGPEKESLPFELKTLRDVYPRDDDAYLVPFFSSSPMALSLQPAIVITANHDAYTIVNSPVHFALYAAWKRAAGPN